MSAIARTYTFTDGTDAYGSQVENEFNTIYNAWNNHDAGTSIWTSLKAALLTMSGNIVMATNKITGLGSGSAAQDAVAVSQIITTVPTVFTITSDAVTTSATYAASNLSASITPSSATRRVKVSIAMNLSGSAGGNTIALTIFAAGSNALAAGGFYTAVGTLPATGAYVSFSYVFSPATASPIIFAVYGKISSGASLDMGNGVPQYMILEEVL